MSDTTTVPLKQYFDSDKNQNASSDATDASKVPNAKPEEDAKSEPKVCRIFAETPPQQKDPTASFFDLIGNQKSGTATAMPMGMMSDLELSPELKNEENFLPRMPISNSMDRRRDAWIPSERTQQILITSATSQPGTFFPDRELLTMPGVLLEEELGDTIGEAVSACLGESEATQRRVLTAKDVTQDERGLRELVQAGAYRAAINLTSELLKVYGQGKGRAGHPSKHSPHSLQLWFTRTALLVKTKAFQVAQTEAEPFGQLDKPDLFYQFYPEMYGHRSGSIASFSFRLLLAELPMHCGKPKESLTKLFSMLATVRHMLSNLKKGLCEDGSPTEISSTDRTDSLTLWNGREVRIMHSIINCALILKDYELAINLLEQLCDRDGAPRHTLLSALGRLHLQLGDVAGAERCFNEAQELKSGPPCVRDLVDKGLIAVAQNSFTDAYVLFQQASNLEPSNVMIFNNMGVCLLYSGQLKEAIEAMEYAISLNPVQALHESLLLNLCTLYDMESSKGRMKKFALLRQLSRYQADAPAAILEKLYG